MRFLNQNSSSVLFLVCFVLSEWQLKQASCHQKHKNHEKRNLNGLHSSTTPHSTPNDFANSLNNNNNFDYSDHRSELLEYLEQQNQNKLNEIKYPYEKRKPSSIVPLSSTKNGQCRETDQSYLDAVLSNFQSKVRKHEEMLLQSKMRFNEMLNPSAIQQQQQPATISGAESPNVIKDQSQCDANERNMTTINQQSLCPWKYVITYRQDRYPAYRTEVKCTCDTCTTWIKGLLLKNTYACMPVLKTQPVLIRSGSCNADGNYKWTPILEEVTVACVCAFAHNHILHL